ncbi:MAG: hypothetical protein Q9210_007318 [Variospora velana]
MHLSSLPLALLLTGTYQVKAHPFRDLYNLKERSANDTELVRRAPEIPPKPSTSGPGSFHGSQFDFLEENNYAPAIDAMPVWVYSTTEDAFVRIPYPHIWRRTPLSHKSQSPCYPEGGDDGKGGPNPGTDVGAGASPGEDCTGPGPESNSPYTLSDPFPTYISASWCGNVDEWRIQFFNYYV